MAVERRDELIVGEWDSWAAPRRIALPARFTSNVLKFIRRKPLGAFCGVTILFFLIIGDIVPESVNSVSKLLGTGDQPVPYLADILEKNFDFIHHYGQADLRNRLSGSSSEHLLGTDSTGRDTFSRLLYGTRIAIMVSFGGMIIATIIQVIINVPAGYYLGWYDKLMYRIMDMADSLPTLIVLIVILGIWGSGLWAMLIAIGFVLGFGGRPLRGQTIQIMTMPYIEAARTSGASDTRIMMRYVIPNLLPLIILYSTFRLGIIVLLEATLSFLGFGLTPPFPSWGQMLSLEGRLYMRTNPELAIYPGLAIGLLVFSFNLFGDALRDVLDPRLRGAR
jgi:peptide/nickel transport system permease protein